MTKQTALIVGTGGGNDIFSGVLAAKALEPKNSWRVDFAGVLSPFHHHDVVPTKIHGLFRTRPSSTRSVRTKLRTRPIGFVDAAVAGLMEEQDLFGAKNVYGLSLAQGTEGLAETFRALSRLYDLIVLTDIGGDIFYGGKIDPHVLSPFFDAMVLRAFVDARVPGLLFEAGPGTDGELEAERLQRLLHAPEVRRTRLRDEDLTWWEALFTKYIEPIRPGRTVPVTIQAARSAEPLVRMQYRGRAHLADRRWYAYFDHAIDTELCRWYYLLDPAQIENPFAVRCKHPFDWFIATQVRQHATNNEANLEYLEHNGRLGQFVTPSPLFTEHEREDMIHTILTQHLIAPAADLLWMHRTDWERYGHPWDTRLTATDRDGLVELTS